jgi:hypothetical protein
MRFTQMVLVLMLSLATTAPGAEPSSRPAPDEREITDPAEVALIATAVKGLKEHLDDFTLSLEYHGPDDPPTFLSLTFRTRPIAGEKRAPWHPAFVVSKTQAERLIDHLAKGNLFLSDANLHAIKDYGLPLRYYTLSVRLHGDGRPRYWVYLRWDKPMFERLDGLRGVLEGEAAAAMDNLLVPLEPVRRRVGAPPEANRPEPATRPATAPGERRAAGGPDPQSAADRAAWGWSAEKANPLYCAVRQAEGKYRVSLATDPVERTNVKIRITLGERELYAWDGHPATV